MMTENKGNLKTSSGVFGARRGIYAGKTSLFTHRNPKTGEVWGEDLVSYGRGLEKPQLGKWVPYDEVEWLKMD